MIRLYPVVSDFVPDLNVLYALLKERKDYQSISHKKMPTWAEHMAFVQSDPYKAWYLIGEDSGQITCFAGSVYLTRQNEIGIFVFESSKGSGIGREAVKQLMEMHDGPYLANINPNNLSSISFFEKLGSDFIQVTYRHE